MSKPALDRFTRDIWKRFDRDEQRAPQPQCDGSRHGARI
jgi:hypothetical protein